MPDLDVHGLRGPVRELAEFGYGFLPGTEQAYQFDRGGWRLGLPSYRDLVRETVGPEGERQQVADLRSGTEAFGPHWLNGNYFNPGGAAAAVTTLRADGSPIRSVLQTAAGDTVFCFKYRCDPDGRVVEAVQYTGEDSPFREMAGRRIPVLAGPGAELGRITFRYDEAGRVVEEVLVLCVGAARRTARRYNEHGDVSWEQVDDGPPSEFDYEYDARGNWTRRVRRSPGAEAETRRRISYWE